MHRYDEKGLYEQIDAISLKEPVKNSKYISDKQDSTNID